MKCLLLPASLLLTVACTGIEPLGTDSNTSVDSGATDSSSEPDSGPTDTSPPPVDADGDGHTSDVDCNDADPEVFPGSEVRVDGRDSNCNGLTEWRVVLYMAVDDIGSACIDNASNVVLPEAGNWQTAQTTELWLESGTHTLGINGRDTGQVITAATAHLEAAGQVVVTDASWKYDPNPTFQDSTRSGWCSPPFDDSAWLDVKVIGPVFTTSPWLNAPAGFPASSPAQWVWDHYPVELNTQYLRRNFTLP